MPGGLLSLVCYGNENILINGNPQVTWFYKSYLRHTHFSQEPIQIPLEGPGQLLMDAPILIKAKIPRQGDLLSDLVLRFQLPDIFSKAYVHYEEGAEGADGQYILDRKYEFAWVRQIGVRIIDSVTFTIGGTKVQEFNADWICARAMLDNDATQYQKWRYMVGDTPEYFDPANGIYSDPENGPSGKYPNVLAWLGSPSNPTPIQNNSPSIPGRIIRVPLGFWFSDYIANSLPLVGLQYHDCEVQIQLRPIRDLYTILDPNNIRLRCGIIRQPYLPSDQYTGVWNPSQYGPLPDSLNNLYSTSTDISGTMRHFLTDIESGVPINDGWPLNATLEATYTFINQAEQKVFATKNLRYNVRQVQNFVFSGVNTRNAYRLDVHNIATRILYFTRRSDAMPYRNQATNLTNWINTQGSLRPFVYPSTDEVPRVPLVPRTVFDPVTGLLTPIGYSGLNIAGLQRGIIRNSFLLANGQSLFSSQDPSYFTEYVPYRYLKGYAAPFNDLGLATQTEMWPLYVYSFALNASDAQQPTGTLNTSRINRLEIDVDVEPIPVLANYTYELQVYVETLNFLEITNGMGGLKFMK